MNLPESEALRAQHTEAAISELLKSVKVFWLDLGLGLRTKHFWRDLRLLSQVNKVNLTLVSVDLEQHELA